MLHMLHLFAFLSSSCIVILFIPPLRKLAFRVGFVDKPMLDNERKIHREPIPLTAGLAIFIAFIVSYIIFVQSSLIKSIAIFSGGLLILIIGTIDDWYKTHSKEFPVLPKLFVQMCAAIIMYLSGSAFEGFTNPFTQQFVSLPVWLQCILTVMWILGVTTVINFSDGMDGLAGGLAAISGGTLFVIALVQQQNVSAMMAIILVGASIGYLRFNKPPAKVFMGDAGATFLGFILAIIALDGAFKQATVLSLFIPILALGVPILDNLFVIIRRMLNGKPFYRADTMQAHYRLLADGLSQKQVVAVLCLVNLCFGLTSIIFMLLQV